MVFDRLQISSIEFRIRRRSAESLEQSARRRVLGQACRRLAGKQSRQEIGAIGRHLENRLIHEVFDHVVTPDVEYERNLRLQSRNVGEVLLRTDSEIDTTWPSILFQARYDVLKLLFIRHVFEAKLAAIFREIRNQFPIRVIDELARQRLCGYERGDNQE